MSEFWIYVQIGLKHVLDINAYDHVLFLIALSLPFLFKDWKKLLLLVSLFTIGHTVALVLSVYEIIIIKANLIEFLIPVTIFVSALFTLFTAKKNGRKESNTIISLITLFFGVIHGLGFSNYFSMIIDANSNETFFPLLSFAIGIELAQLIVVLFVVTLSYIVQHFFRVNRRDWILVMSAIVIGVVIPMLMNSEIFETN